MTERIEPSMLRDRRDLAAYWFARLESEDVTVQERMSFETWLNADSKNAEAFHFVEDIWRAAEAIPASKLRNLGQVSRPALASRRRFAWGLGLACSGVLAFAVADPAKWLASPNYRAEFSTAPGERRQVGLPDGSIALLNTATTLRVSFYQRERLVELLQGEALFTVDGSQGEPFIVDAGAGTVRVTGTQFHVRRESDAFSVGVLEGMVEVESGRWWNKKTVRLMAGQSAAASTASELDAGHRVDVEAATAWREGKVVFRGTPLELAINEVNRYLKQPVLIGAPDIGKLRISGVFSVDEPAALLAALPSIIPVRVRVRPDGRQEILPF
ncbi:MAG: FecR family protein [Pusillimonas sp.]